MALELKRMRVTKVLMLRVMEPRCGHLLCVHFQLVRQWTVSMRGPGMMGRCVVEEAILDEIYDLVAGKETETLTLNLIGF